MKIKKISIPEQDHVQLSSKTSGENYSYSHVLSELAGFKDLFIHHEIIPSGHRASRAHMHTVREERHVLAYVEDQAISLQENDVLSIPPNSGLKYYIKNEGEEDARILVIASNPPNDHIIFGD